MLRMKPEKLDYASDVTVHPAPLPRCEGREGREGEVLRSSAWCCVLAWAVCSSIPALILGVCNALPLLRVEHGGVFQEDTASDSVSILFDHILVVGCAIQLSPSKSTWPELGTACVSISGARELLLFLSGSCSFVVLAWLLHFLSVF